MQKTNIPWTEFSWNPSIGCENTCSYCYARKVHNMRHKAYMAGKKLPVQYAKPFEEIQLFHDRLEDPLRRKKPAKIFVGSVADLFSPSVPFDFIDKVMAVIALCSQHQFQVLTKRPERMGEYMDFSTDNRGHAIELQMLRLTNGEADCYIDGNIPNLWLGVTAENQEWWDKRKEVFLSIPAAVHFVSNEPNLGLIRFTPDELKQLDQVIVGAESGPGARYCPTANIRSVVNQCKAAGVKCFVKQIHMWKANWDNRVYETAEEARLHIGCANPKRVLIKDIDQFPAGLQIREYPKGE